MENIFVHYVKKARGLIAMDLFSLVIVNVQNFIERNEIVLYNNNERTSHEII